VLKLDIRSENTGVTVVVSWFQTQKMMRKVLFSLLPIAIFSIYAYGYRVLWLGAWVFLAGILTEWIVERGRKKKVSEAVLVTCLLFTLSLPPVTPWWVAVLGIVFGVFFAKEVYGGFGRNVFNPAIVSRLFVYLTFPNLLTTGWIAWSHFGSNPVTAATPLALLKVGETPGLAELFFGIRAGSLGEGPIFLVIAAAIYLIWSKTASWRIMLSTALSGVLFTFLFDWLKVPGALDALPAIFSGSFLFVTVFMATDPVSAPKKTSSLWIYGTIIGTTAVLIRTFSFFPEGMSFAVLIGNAFAPLIDLLMPKKKAVVRS
jgi:Na+-transporting NADH:ubiquinone oxidoreductase subunit B